MKSLNKQENGVDVVIDDGRIEAIEEYRSPEDLFTELISRMSKYHPSQDFSLVEKAYYFAKQAHKDQRRKSGEEYVIHPLYVAIILADMELDKESIAAGLLHDVVEDTDYTAEDIRHEFGDEVASIVEGLTKLTQIKLPEHDSASGNDRTKLQAENLRKMFLAMAKDIRVILIKLADRLHNMRTLSHQSPESQQRISRETIEIYAPLAERLGISKFKVELDDLSLKYLEPEQYSELVEEINMRRSDREIYIKNIVDEISKNIQGKFANAKIDGRVKHFFSIYKKKLNQGKTIDQLYDLFAVRILVDTVEECYSVLGIIHDLYKPMPGRFKDYIAQPKPNSYRSLHTTLFGAYGKPFEIQIRTHEMHREAEYGITAHWKYKVSADGIKTDTSEEEKFRWLREILELHQETPDNEEFLSSIKSDLDVFSDTVFCFTPLGEVKNLPMGSTPIDFAYAVHSAVGNKMIGARVNGRLVSIDYQIQNGDHIEILTSQNSHGPSHDWLNIVKSAQAKNKIRQWFKSEYKAENIARGKELLSAYCKARGINLADLCKPEFFSEILSKYGFNNWDSVLAAVGHGGMKEGVIINKLIEAYEKTAGAKSNEEVIAEIAAASDPDPASSRVRNHSGIIVKGVEDVAVRIAKCCSPLPGDEITGFVTRGRGVSIHRTDCANIVNLPEADRARIITAQWQKDPAKASLENYLAEIRIFSENRRGLLADITKVIAEKKININSASTRVTKQNMAICELALDIKNREELVMIIEKIRSIESVIDIERSMNV